jgi:hypothetical protein
MLKLTVAMLTLNWIISIFLFILSPFLQSDQVLIDSPKNGDLVQGIVEIRGSTNIRDFKSAEVSFGFIDDKSETWFPIQFTDQPKQNDVLTNWDTTTITDGDYRIRVLVNLTDGTQVEARATEIRVRNYSRDEKISRTDTVPTSFPQPLATVAIPSPTPMQANPAEVSEGALTFSLLQGAAGAGILFFALAIYFSLRSINRHH